MSKLDYVTIGIVAVCIAAIIFLVIKTSNLMSNGQGDLEPNRVDETLGEQPGYGEEEIYAGAQGGAGDAVEAEGYPQTGEGAEDPDDDDAQYYDPVGEQDRFADEQPAAEPAPPRQQEAERLTSRGSTPATSAPAAAEPERQPTGDYLVLAGSFRQKANAEQMVSRLKKLGFENAAVTYFNKGTYAVALVERYQDEDAARALVTELKSKHGIDSRVKKDE